MSNCYYITRKNNMDNYNYPVGADNSDAPWNQPDIPLDTVNVSFAYYKTWRDYHACENEQEGHIEVSMPVDTDTTTAEKLIKDEVMNWCLANNVIYLEDSLDYDYDPDDYISDDYEY